MGELARQRNARDMWLSKSHLQAMLTGTLLLVGTAFGVGFLVGKGPTRSDASQAVSKDESLVALLAQVEASQQPRSGVDSLTFPSVLEGQAAAAPGVAAAAPGAAADDVVTAVAGGAPGAADVADPVPPGTHTIVAGRFSDLGDARALKAKLAAAGQPAWTSFDIVDGKATITVSIGGFDDEATAKQAMTDMHGAIDSLGLHPEVRSIHPSDPAPAAPQ
jgi:hypothetical protein